MVQRLKVKDKVGAGKRQEKSGVEFRGTTRFIRHYVWQFSLTAPTKGQGAPE